MSQLQQEQAFQLPTDVWAKVLDNLYLEEILPVAGSNRFFRKDVFSKVKFLFIRETQTLKTVAKSQTLLPLFSQHKSLDLHFK